MFTFVAAAAILSSGLYAGASWYITFVELPALFSGPTEVALTHWAHSVRLTPWYAGTALIGTAAGLVVGHAAISSPWSWGALALFCVLPITTIAVLPLQHRLLAQWYDDGTTRSLARLKAWGRLHAVRTALGLLANILFLWAALAGARPG